MITRICRGCAWGLLFAAAGALINSRAALAAVSADAPSHEITVVGSPGETAVKRVIGRTAFGGKVELITIKRKVSYADLDLVKHADVLALQSRVSSTAKEECGDLVKTFPLIEPGRDCVKRAVARTSPEMDAVVAAAEKRD